MSSKIVARGGCACCPRTEDVLSMNEVLYQGFGGYHVTKNSKIFYCAEPDTTWEKFKTLADIEKIAKRSPSASWKIILNNPMRGATWKRKRGKWILIESNNGFA